MPKDNNPFQETAEEPKDISKENASPNLSTSDDSLEKKKNSAGLFKNFFQKKENQELGDLSSGSPEFTTDQKEESVSQDEQKIDSSPSPDIRIEEEEDKSHSFDNLSPADALDSQEKKDEGKPSETKEELNPEEEKIDFSVLRTPVSLEYEKNILTKSHPMAEDAISAAFENIAIPPSSAVDSVQESPESEVKNKKGEKKSLFSSLLKPFQKEKKKEEDLVSLPVLSTTSSSDSSDERLEALEKSGLDSDWNSANHNSGEQDLSVDDLSWKDLQKGDENSLHQGAEEKIIVPSESNAFAEAFGEKKANSQDLIDTIMQTAKEEQDARSKVLGARFSEQIRQNKERSESLNDRNRDAKKILTTARFSFFFSLLIPLCSWVVFSALLDPENNFAEILNAHSYGKEYEEISRLKESRESIVKTRTKEINDAVAKVENIKNNKILANIVQTRVDFLDIMLRINKITLSALHLTTELNHTLQELAFNSYSGSTNNGKTDINISGTVRDPERKSLTRLTKLMETINSDPVFAGAAIRSFSKSDDRTGGSQSGFSFRFTYSPVVESAEDTLHASSSQ